MDEFELRATLDPRPMRYLPTTGSTNADAVAWLSEDPTLASGAVVIANEQTRGRGRKGRDWITPSGSAIAMSLILKDFSAPMHATMLGAVAVAETLDTYAPERVGLKWSNDVQIDGKKVCGILAESAWEGQTLSAIVLGMGINIAVDFKHTALETEAISLHEVTGTLVNRVNLIARILERISFWEAEIKGTYGVMPLFNTWKNRLTTLGKPVTVISEKQTITGTALDVDQEGALLVELADGRVERFLAADVSVRG